MNIEQTVIELLEPLKKLINFTKPNPYSLDGGMKFVQVGNVQMSVDLATNGVYTFVITREPDLGLKVLLDGSFHLLNVPIFVGPPREILKTVINAINKLKEDGNE